MKPLWIVLGVIGIVIVVMVFSYISMYNNLVRMDENVKEKFGNIQSAYQRRADLIPNLVSTVQGYAAHEKGVLEAVTQARASATQVKLDLNDAKSMQQYQAAQGELSGALSRLLVTVEKYPDLKANQNFMALQDELSGTENRIKQARNDYNASVKDYNTYVRGFFVSMFMSGKFPVREMFEADKGAEKAPQVKF